jgi:hypothetical protein
MLKALVSRPLVLLLDKMLPSKSSSNRVHVESLKSMLLILAKFL